MYFLTGVLVKGRPVQYIEYQSKLIYVQVIVTTWIVTTFVDQFINSLNLRISKDNSFLL